MVCSDGQCQDLMASLTPPDVIMIIQETASRLLGDYLRETSTLERLKVDVVTIPDSRLVADSELDMQLTQLCSELGTADALRLIKHKIRVCGLLVLARPSSRRPISSCSAATALPTFPCISSPTCTVSTTLLYVTSAMLLPSPV